MTPEELEKLFELGPPIAIPHMFDSDVRATVLVNHDLVLQAIAKSEEDELSKLDFTDESQRSIEDFIQREHDEFRRAANNLALVGLVTRFHHWLGRLSDAVEGRRSLNRKIKDMLTDLKNRFPNSQLAPNSYFKALEDVRDSIVHADSEPEWMNGKEVRKVNDEYVDEYKVNFSAEKLKDAFDKMLALVEYYDGCLKRPIG